MLLNLFLVLVLLLSVSTAHELKSSIFHFFNVNLDCRHLYCGQWLCVNNMTLY
ncbi:hypothetical protein ACJRO7_017426 [Eucalyptus globulus]|uniref:Uncharacterized protein n=1 Tax=Eucalyptus globulus TaxID=34317 RepID=A0ABD3L1E3_EUCGL